MSKKLFFGNWKMYLSDHEAVELAQAYVDIASECDGWVMAAAPSFTALERVSHLFDGSGVGLASQDGFWEEDGAFTGEISMETLRELNVRFVIVGHSEQRKFRGVTDEMVAKQVVTALEHGLTAIVCVGETEDEKASGEREAVVRRQVTTALEHADDAGHIIVAYEPRWAIGTGEACTPEEAVTVHALIRDLLEERFGRSGAKVPILYGGSVNGENVDGYLKEDLIGGVLVGGASTRKEDVKRIICGT